MAIVLARPRRSEACSTCIISFASVRVLLDHNCRYVVQMSLLTGEVAYPRVECTDDIFARSFWCWRTDRQCSVNAEHAQVGPAGFHHAVGKQEEQIAGAEGPGGASLSSLSVNKPSGQPVLSSSALTSPEDASTYPGGWPALA